MCKSGNRFSLLILIGREAWPFIFCSLPSHIRFISSINRFPVIIARKRHPFPFRTRKLSSSAPMVLRGQLRGREGRRRNLFLKPLFKRGFFLCPRGPQSSESAHCVILRIDSIRSRAPWVRNARAANPSEGRHPSFSLSIRVLEGDSPRESPFAPRSSIAPPVLQALPKAQPSQ